MNHTLLQELFALYIFTWNEALTFAHKLRKAMIDALIEDEALHIMISEIEEKAKHTQKIEARWFNRNNLKNDIQSPMSQVRQLLKVTRAQLDGAMMIHHSEDPMHIEARALSEHFFCDLNLMQMRAEVLRSYAATLMASMRDEAPRWATLRLEHLRAPLEASIEALDARLNTTITPVAFEALRAARVAHQDAMTRVIAHVVLRYEAPERAEARAALLRAIQGVNAMVAAARQPRPTPSTEPPSPEAPNVEAR